VPAEVSRWDVGAPFAPARRADGKIVGRGAQDMKCVVAGYLEVGAARPLFFLLTVSRRARSANYDPSTIHRLAMRGRGRNESSRESRFPRPLAIDPALSRAEALRRLVAARPRALLRRRIVLTFVPDEEIGGGDGMGRLLASDLWA
jgi:hypothetical protein